MSNCLEVAERQFIEIKNQGLGSSAVRVQMFFFETQLETFNFYLPSCWTASMIRFAHGICLPCLAARSASPPEERFTIMATAFLRQSEEFRRKI